MNVRESFEFLEEIL